MYRVTILMSITNEVANLSQPAMENRRRFNVCQSLLRFIPQCTGQHQGSVGGLLSPAPRLGTPERGVSLR